MAMEADVNASNLTTKTAAVLIALRENAERTFVTRADGSVWNDVYLDNARIDGMSVHSFAGHLAALERAGFYRSHGDDCFGTVRMEG